MHELHRAEVPLMSEKALPRLEEVALEAALIVPRDAAPSFYAPSNELAWSVRVEVKVEGWPDWSLEEPLLVLPA
jgi:hypothetical protein